VSAADRKRGRAMPRPEIPPAYGACPRCGRVGEMRPDGAELLRCQGRGCGASVPRREVRELPRPGGHAPRQAGLFGEADS
jgi:hypothetical protein